ncbi:GNAT family N-acetyltransferase [Streptomyces sp. NPDC058374]|uniref:GNAT family N-acetyltransferase n=1 Tax=unclassified Streptomyces TaxID=2593676 RepID=UPI003654D8A4
MYAPVSTPAFLPAGPGLSLRPWRARDARELIDAYRDPLLRKFTRTWPADEAGARAWLAREEAGARDGSRYSFAVELAAQAPDGTGPAPSGVRDPAATGILAGCVVLKTFPPDDRPARTDTAEVGYWTTASVRGRGLAGRAVLALSDWAFTALPALARLELLHQVDNEPSCRVAEKAGFPLHETLAPQPPVFPLPGHVHVRPRPRA